jgi:hypothetical protein
MYNVRYKPTDRGDHDPDDRHTFKMCVFAAVVKTYSPMELKDVFSFASLQTLCRRVRSNSFVLVDIWVKGYYQNFCIQCMITECDVVSGSNKQSMQYSVFPKCRVSVEDNKKEV